MKRHISRCGQLFCFAGIICLLISGCKQQQTRANRTRGDLPIETNEVVNLAIVNSCKMAAQRVDMGSSMFNRDLGEMSEELKNMDAKHQDIKWIFNFHQVRPQFSFTADNGQARTSFTEVMTGDSYLEAKSDGKDNYVITFKEGEVSFGLGNVSVKEGTKLSVNNSSYVFNNNSWVKDAALKVK